MSERAAVSMKKALRPHPAAISRADAQDPDINVAPKKGTEDIFLISFSYCTQEEVAAAAEVEPDKAARRWRLTA